MESGRIVLPALSLVNRLGLWNQHTELGSTAGAETAESQRMAVELQTRLEQGSKCACAAGVDLTVSVIKGYALTASSG